MKNLTKMTSRSELLWQSLTGTGTLPVHRRVSPNHPLDLFAQLDGAGQVGLLAISSQSPGDVPTYTSVDVSIGLRSDGAWATSISLRQPQLRQLFAAMCDEIIDQGETTTEGTQAGGFVLHLLARWQRLLALGPDGLLSSQQRLGLAGELTILTKAITHLGPGLAIDAWRGPLDAPQDFVFPTFLVEVKSITLGGTEVIISSSEQLDIKPSALSLAVCEFIIRPATKDSGTLSSMVSQIREKVMNEPEAAGKFEILIREAGFIDRDEYTREEYNLTQIQWYTITENFPCLRRSELPSAITKAKYSLEISQLSPFKVAERGKPWNQ
ncbi:PD-(D/E)XK motif protein [Castellaniella sp.]|uniref:PD-(D/E)XK motif protein n=1 Tax=Castellaniella sp. TaxID=1955812 RepID=UPI003C745782